MGFGHGLATGQRMYTRRYDLCTRFASWAQISIFFACGGLKIVFSNVFWTKLDQFWSKSRPKGAKNFRVEKIFVSPKQKNKHWMPFISSEIELLENWVPFISHCFQNLEFPWGANLSDFLGVFWRPKRNFFLAPTARFYPLEMIKIRFRIPKFSCAYGAILPFRNDQNTVQIPKIFSRLRRDFTL